MVSPLFETTQDELAGSSVSNKQLKSMNLPNAIWVLTDSFRNRPIGAVVLEKDSVCSCSAATENCSCTDGSFSCSVKLIVAGRLSLSKSGGVC